MSQLRSIIIDDGTSVDTSPSPCIKRRCELLGINRATVYYKPRPLPPHEIARRELIMQKIDIIHMKQPYLGARKIARKIVREHGIAGVGKKLVRRLMEQMGIYAIYPKPNTSKANKAHKKFPYLLRNMDIFLPNQARWPPGQCAQRMTRVGLLI
jgi:putative transposase